MKGKTYGLYNTNNYISVSTRQVLSKERLEIFQTTRKAPSHLRLVLFDSNISLD